MRLTPDSGMLRCGRREIDGKHAAFAREVAHRKLAAVRLHCLAGDGKSEAHAASLRPSPRERSKHLIRLSRRETAALILDLDDDASDGCPDPQPDVSGRARGLESVLNQVTHIP